MINGVENSIIGAYTNSDMPDLWNMNQNSGIQNRWRAPALFGTQMNQPNLFQSGFNQGPSQMGWPSQRPLPQLDFNQGPSQTGWPSQRPMPQLDFNQGPSQMVWPSQGSNQPNFNLTGPQMRLFNFVQQQQQPQPSIRPQVPLRAPTRSPEMQQIVNQNRDAGILFPKWFGRMKNG